MKLETFDFNSAAVRVMVRDDAPWFVAADVCRVLELSNPTECLRGLDEDEKTTLSNPEGRPGQPGAKVFNIISESGLYALVFKSRKPVARVFRKWVTGEVLPAIRKTGRYDVAADAALAADAPGEVVRMSLIGFVRARGAAWPLERKIQYGLLARRYAKAMGLVAEVAQDAEMGAVLTFPVALLEEVGLQHGARLCAGSAAVDNQGLVEALAALLLEKRPEGGFISARELRALAVERGLWAKKEDVMALGRVLSPHAGRRLLDGWCWRGARTERDRGWRLDRYGE